MFALDQPQLLAILGEGIKAPQSFQYFSTPAVEAMSDYIAG